ncbi:hypothetical protein QMK33_22135 [Hymenobacter sp. H14-R3]|uniref:hypothetical protein n=1 Tax=Hymenobacter sp. H14-R3 TaxID=3046308 RepID=UPI0024B99C3C|nr:hypothetical protein [Hymenobacter sp. H14-R3]MDJ0367854.1 hypothetical protein [Hymenobacter sp. H14-R3]
MSQLFNQPANQHFSPVRFGRLMRKQTTEYWRTYLLSAAVLLGGVVAVVGGLTYLMRRPLDNETQTLLFMAGLLTTGLAFTATVFAEMSNGRRAAAALLLPASHLEKYLVAWLYSLPVFLVIYIAVFLAVDALMLQWAGHSYPQFPRQILDLTSSWRPLLTGVASYSLVHALALYGAIYFQSLHIIKTSFAVLGGVVMLLMMNFWMWKLLTSELHTAVPFGNGFAGGKDHPFLVELPQQLSLLALLPLALAVLLWAAAYARLTEKQL